MKKLLLLLVFLSTFSIQETVAKRVRYYFKTAKVYNTDRNNPISTSWGIFIVELNTDNQTVNIKIKLNGEVNWRTFNLRIKGEDRGESIDGKILATSYECHDNSFLNLEYNRVRKYTTVYWELAVGRGNLDFGRPYKVEKF